MGMARLQGNYFLLLVFLMNAPQIESQEEVLNAFECLGNVIQNYNELSRYSGCSTDIGEHCYEDEIICHSSTVECRLWGVSKTDVSLYIQFPSSRFIEASKTLNLGCRCKEYTINCTINSEVLIQRIVHNDAFLTSTISSSSLELTEAITTMESTTNKPSTTDPSQKSNPGKLADSSTHNSEAPYSAIIGALFGGVVLGAGVEYLLIILLRKNRHLKNRKSKEDIAEMSKHNPAYSVSSESAQDFMRPDEQFTTQIVNSNNMYQNTPQSTANIHRQRQKTHETSDQSIYNHLHERKETDDVSDHYDHARPVPFQLNETEKNYEKLRTTSHPANTYTEVIPDGHEHTKNQNGEGNEDYFVLENKQ